VNGYLREAAGEHFTAKDFRTWAGSVLACVTLGEIGPFETKTEAKRNVVAAIKQVAEKLGNTPSVCRKCYVHPVVLDSYLKGSSNGEARRVLDLAIAATAKKLREDERQFLALLAQRVRLQG
jgi:DNA topoisomerase-1